MLFNSIEFMFAFLPLTLLVFYQIGRRGYQKWAIAWLVAASLFFYSWWNPSYLALLIFSILFNYYLGSALSGKFQLPVSQKWQLAFGIIVNLALIGYFKYANFFVSTVNDLVGTNFNLHRIILPLAISFFTFQQIAYLVDAYRGETKEYNFLNYCLFVSFFPQLIAGPIVHHKDILPQFAQKSLYRFNYENLTVGLTIFSLGLFKKVALADTVAVYATPVFNAAATGGQIAFLEAWGGVLAYTMQLYFDFSGYSDMAIGAARMFGIKLPVNFNSPYKSVNIIDFWRRWHITLSHFLRDYLYIPLGGSRKGKVRRFFNLMITMLLGGLWHGAGWTFVFWGGLHGVYLIINHQWHSFRRSLGHDLNKIHWWGRILGCWLTFMAVVVAWIFFRAENMEAAFNILRGISGANGIVFPERLADMLGIKFILSHLGVTFKIGGVTRLLSTYIDLIFLLTIAWLFPNTQEWMAQYQPVLKTEQKLDNSQGTYNFWRKLQWQPTLPFALIVGSLIFFSLKTFLSAKVSEFLYFNF
ncbi:MAG: MBOAT family protein [Okeania sp. SIO3I5]|uniref:MBOAT family O-acyltransferase n=1 Tax=Okeania sp. SIO3I5 TaxID=2607805 RepID=UPI0013B6AD8F|nr:MBOAT family protein [Okeania sp. SIO3I5]NEQ35659.1 MBOAT family protein [Okeania sp. SIO3I5]